MPEPVVTTSRTGRLQLPYLFPAQAQKEAFVNEALARLDALAMPAVIDERAAPPATPQPGDCHLVAADPTGAFAGQAGAIASFAHNQWLFTAPRPGMRVHDAASGGTAVFAAGLGWRRADAPPAPAGGAVVDTEARAALAALTTALRNLAIFG